ncbi:hypothetical protein JOC54_004022 [Alkalihalobacillus xiaoxiensis]|uniref:Uncharacterized protein n=1 Tax=Shouchella xiaoxiensis TaxID=766895 RepID=A0ABS2T202_9BACI|nr:hypothetical protein [Shouchella xiaoxiensis]MBM7840729.1 hypothetical protein [Shouchella xiaoxiensis]
MSTKELWQLRKKQIFWLNGGLIVTLGTYITLLTMDISIDAIQFGVGLFFLLVGTVSVVTKREVLYLLPSLKKLMEYEKDKLGDEWNRSRLTGSFMQIGLGLLFILFNLPPFSDNLFNPSTATVFFMIALFILIGMIANVSLLFGYHKIDRSTTEQLKGYTYKSVLIGALIGAVLVMIVMISLGLFFAN